MEGGEGGGGATYSHPESDVGSDGGELHFHNIHLQIMVFYNKKLLEDKLCCDQNLTLSHDSVE